MQNAMAQPLSGGNAHRHFTGVAPLRGFNLRAALVNHCAAGVIPTNADFWYCAALHVRPTSVFAPIRERFFPCGTSMRRRQCLCFRKVDENPRL
jgi:hypothetical protein